jgi:polyisoprenyl-phosphate glycosyltransferase
MKLISIIVPVFNEEQNVPLFYVELKKTWERLHDNYDFELIFINDGSSDRTHEAVSLLAASDTRIKFIEFARNFGKEMATSAGLHVANGDAAIMIDADLQHPIELIPDFIKKWEMGGEVVIGVRSKTLEKSVIKKTGSKLFYHALSFMGDIQIVPNATDYRLLDRQVVNEFKRFTEHNRITRGLIDWLGFKRDYIMFVADERRFGKPGYNKIKLLKLAMSTFVAHSLLPLKLAGYLGAIITLFSGPLGLFIFVTKFFMGDPFLFSGPAILAVINLFLIGIVLSSLGLIALYIGSIYGEVVNRPMYVVRKSNL